MFSLAVSTIRRRSTFLCGFSLFSLQNPEDKVDPATETAKGIRALYKPEEKTGWDRLKAMFSVDEFGNESPEMLIVKNASLAGLFTGAMIGAVIHSKAALHNFMEKNQGTAFTSHFEAKRQLQNQVTLAFGRGAFYWGWRMGLFTGLFVLFETSISTYRGKTGIAEFILGGAIAGGIYKMPLGPRGMIAGSIVGGAVGCIGGALVVASLKLTGNSMEEIRYWQYQWKQDRRSEIEVLQRRKREREASDLIKTHNQAFGALSPLDNIDSGGVAAAEKTE